MEDPLRASELQRDADRKRKKRASERDVEIPTPVDLGRRRACLADPVEFMRTYFGWIFSQPFVPSRQAMVDSIIHSARYGGDYAVAGGRGSGKSAIALFTTAWLLFRNEVPLPLIVGKNQKGAENELTNLKKAIYESPVLADDFPEIVLPILALDDWASAARKQTVGGIRTEIGWERDCIFFPTVPRLALPSDWPEDEPSAARGQGIAVAGIDGRLRGYKKRNTRPSMVIIDDIDDRESARSDVQTQDNRVAIDQDIIGLAGSGKRTSRVMLCTTINTKCVAAIYTAMPSWRGQRFKSITTMPAREDLRDEYLDLREKRSHDDPDARVAHKFYLENRDEIERGGAVDNPYDFVSTELNGEPLEVSAIQHYFNFIADTNWTTFLCEWQNDPPADADQIKLGISRELVQKRVSGLARWELPPDSKVVVAIDLGKTLCHWVAGAFREGGACNVVHYGTIEVSGTEDADNNTPEGKQVIERAVYRALVNWKDEIASQPFRDSDGNPVEPSLVLIDSGYWMDTVYEFVRNYGDRYRATKGRGEGVFRHGTPSAKRKVGNHWFATRQQTRVWLYDLDADYWKRSVHERFIAEPFDENNRPNPGSLTLFIPEGHRHGHRTYSAHVLAEEWVTEFVPEKGEKSKFIKHSGNNHYLDATAMMLAGGEMAGLGLFERRTAVVTKSPEEWARAAGR